MSDEVKPACDLCGDVGILHLHALCHPSAPLRAELDGPAGTLKLYCYDRDCNRLVATFNISGVTAARQNRWGKS
jgi:hypothetical protein